MAEYVKIKENADWYYANLDSLLPKYRGRFVGVVDCGVFGAYDDCLDGVLALEKAGNPRGTFIVHKCIPLEEEKKEWSFLARRVRSGGCMQDSGGDSPFKVQDWKAGRARSPSAPQPRTRGTFP